MAAQQDPPLNLQKIEELESIRGIAAMLIVFFHVPKWSSILDIGIINNGYLMVELFFVLSGFVIYSAYANKIFTPKDLVRFQFLRFGRLYPVHLLFLGVFLLIETAKYYAQTKYNLVSPNTRPFTGSDLTAGIEHLFLVQAIGPTGKSNTFNYVAWSISTEFYTYLIFGLSVLLAAKMKNILFSVIALASVFLLSTDNTFGFVSLLRCLAGFFIGCLTAEIRTRLNLKIPEHTSLLARRLGGFFTKCASLLALGAIVLFLQLKTTKQYDCAIFFLTAVLILSIVLSKDGYLNDFLKFKVLTWLGTISYALYMSHGAIIWFVNQFIRVILKKPEMMSRGKSVSQLNDMETLLGFIVVVGISLLVSAIIYNFIEKPMRAKSRQFAFNKLS